MKVKLFVVAAVAMLLGSCSGSQNNTTASGVVVGSSLGVDNMIAECVEIYDSLYKGVDIKGVYMPQEEIIDSLVEGKLKLAIVGRGLTDNELAKMESAKLKPRMTMLAMDAVAIIENNANGAKPLFVRELKSILSGETTKWVQLEPSKLGEIHVVMGPKNGMIAHYVSDSLMSGVELASNIEYKKTPAEVIEAVMNDPNAIGLVSVSQVAKDSEYAAKSASEKAQMVNEAADVTNIDFTTDVKVVAIRPDDQVDAYQPHSAYIYGKDYVLEFPLYAVTTSVVGSQTNKFYNFILQAGQKILVKNGVVPSVNYR